MKLKISKTNIGAPAPSTGGYTRITFICVMVVVVVPQWFRKDFY